MDQRKHPGRLAHVSAASVGSLMSLGSDVVSSQTLCECALTSPYIILKLGMMAVLSTLSGTIAIKQYLSNMTGYAKVFPSEYRDFIFVCFPTKLHKDETWCAD